MISDFNYLIVLAEIDGEEYFLDASDKYLSFGQIPFRSLNQYGRLIDFDNESDWIGLKSSNLSSETYFLQMDLDADLNLTGKLNKRSTGYRALKAKKNYFNDEEGFLDEFEENHESLEIDNHQIATENITDENFNAQLNFKKTLDLVGNKVYLSPFIIRFFSKNPFQLQRRSYPVDFGYKKAFIYTATINLDENFVVKELPQPITLSLPDQAASFSSKYVNTGKMIQIYFKLVFNQAIYEPELYFGLKKIMLSVVEAQKNDIILLEKIK